MIPLFKYGKWNDFAMRVSIPPLIVLFILAITYLWKRDSKNNRIKFTLRKGIVVLILLIGSITPFHEIHRSMEAIKTSGGSPPISDHWLLFDFGGYLDKMETVQNFVVSDPESRLFFRFFGKN
jgi:hypothetical protein